VRQLFKPPQAGLMVRLAAAPSTDSVVLERLHLLTIKTAKIKLAVVIDAFMEHPRILASISRRNETTLRTLEWWRFLTSG
jgi:hypothetical protein